MMRKPVEKRRSGSVCNWERIYEDFQVISILVLRNEIGISFQILRIGVNRESGSAERVG